MRVTIIILAASMVMPSIVDGQILPWRRRVAAVATSTPDTTNMTDIWGNLKAVPTQTCVGGQCYAGAQEVTQQFELQRSIAPATSYEIPVTPSVQSVQQYNPMVAPQTYYQQPTQFTSPLTATYQQQYVAPQTMFSTQTYTDCYAQPSVATSSMSCYSLPSNFEAIVAAVLARVPAGPAGPAGRDGTVTNEQLQSVGQQVADQVIASLPKIKIDTFKAGVLVDSQEQDLSQGDAYFRFEYDPSLELK